MSKGSKRVTIRVGEELLELIDEAIERHNAVPGIAEHWNRSDFIIKAIEDKLNHGHRSAKRDREVRVIKVDDNMPREVEAT